MDAILCWLFRPQAIILNTLSSYRSFVTYLIELKIVWRDSDFQFKTPSEIAKRVFGVRKSHILSLGMKWRGIASKVN